MSKMRYETASSRWDSLNSDRTSFVQRCEKYSALTIPRICPPDHYNQNTNELQHDWQSLGAQAVNHLTNKLMLALFAPSRPFFKIEASNEAKEKFQQEGVDGDKLREILSEAERKAIAVMDSKSLRPKLNEVITHLIVTGNVMLVLDKKKLRVIGLKKYVCKRDINGDVIELIICDTLKFSQLEKNVRDLFPNKDRDDEVKLFKWIVKDDNDFRMTQWVDEKQLPEKFNGKWDQDSLPYRALTWVISDGADYGTGHVEDYCGEFESISTLSRAETQGAVLASEYRWLVNPAGQTQVEDMETSENGAAIPGQQGDITLVNTGTVNALPHIKDIISSRENRIGRGFLMGSAVTRNAERVTAEEIRMQANELETALGGVYSRIAVDLQIPMSVFLLKEINIGIDGKLLKPVIITGLEALSRNGDLDAMKMFLGDLGSIQSLHPSVIETLNMKGVISILSSGHGVLAKDVMLSDEQIQANIAARNNQQAMGADGAPPGVPGVPGGPVMPPGPQQQ